MTFRLLHRRIGRPHSGKRNDPEDEVGELEGIDWSDCVSTAVKRMWHIFFHLARFHLTLVDITVLRFSQNDELFCR